MKLKNVYLYFLIILGVLSHKNLVAKSNPDSTYLLQINQLINRGNQIVQFNSDSALIYGEQALTIINNTTFSDKDSKLKIKHKCLSYLSFVYYSFKQNFDMAFDLTLQNLKLYEKENNVLGMAATYQKLAGLYYTFNKPLKASEYYIKSEETLKAYILKSNDTSNKALDLLFNLYLTESDFYFDLDSISKGVYFAQLAEQQLKKLDFNKYKDSYYVLKSNVAKKLHDYDLAIYYYELLLKDFIPTNNLTGVAYYTLQLGEVWESKKNFTKAAFYADSALRLSKRNGFKKELLDSYIFLTHLNETTGNYKEAYYYLKEKTALEKSIYSSDAAGKILSMENKSEYEKKKAVAEAENKAEILRQKSLAAEKSKKQKIIIGMVSVVLVLAIVFAVFMYNRFRVTNQQKAIIQKQKNQVDDAFNQLDLKNKEIALQKMKVEEQHKEVMDSINYARRIQQALLPTQKYISKYIKK